jgi:hypothetical protein
MPYIKRTTLRTVLWHILVMPLLRRYRQKDSTSSQPRQKRSVRPSLNNKIGVVVHIYNLSYMEGEGIVSPRKNVRI